MSLLEARDNGLLEASGNGSMIKFQYVDFELNCIIISEQMEISNMKSILIDSIKNNWTELLVQTNIESSRRHTENFIKIGGTL